MSLFGKKPKVGDTFTDGGREFTVTAVGPGGVESMLTSKWKAELARRKEEEKAAPVDVSADVERLTAELAEVRGEKDTAVDDAAKQAAEVERLTAELAVAAAKVEELEKELAAKAGRAKG